MSGFEGGGATVVPEVAYWFVLSLFMPDGSVKREVYGGKGGFSNVQVCELVMARKVEEATYLMRPYKLRGISTGPCTPGKPVVD